MPRYSHQNQAPFEDQLQHSATLQASFVLTCGKISHNATIQHTPEISRASRAVPAAGADYIAVCNCFIPAFQLCQSLATASCAPSASMLSAPSASLFVLSGVTLIWLCAHPCSTCERKETRRVYWAHENGCVDRCTSCMLVKRAG